MPDAEPSGSDTGAADQDSFFAGIDDYTGPP